MLVLVLDSTTGRWHSSLKSQKPLIPLIWRGRGSRSFKVIDVGTYRTNTCTAHHISVVGIQKSLAFKSLFKSLVISGCFRCWRCRTDIRGWQRRSTAHQRSSVRAAERNHERWDERRARGSHCQQTGLTWYALPFPLCFVSAVRSTLTLTEM